MCVVAYQGHMRSLRCVMRPVLILYLTTFPSVKEQQFMCHIIQLTGHYSRGNSLHDKVMMMMRMMMVVMVMMMMMMMMMMPLPLNVMEKRT